MNEHYILSMPVECKNTYILYIYKYIYVIQLSDRVDNVTFPA